MINCNSVKFTMNPVEGVAVNEGRVKDCTLEKEDNDRRCLGRGFRVGANRL